MGFKQKKYKNGEEYNGDWNGNQRHGYGTHQWPDNRIYVGFQIGLESLRWVIGRSIQRGQNARPRKVSMARQSTLCTLFCEFSHSSLPSILHHSKLQCRKEIF